MPSMSAHDVHDLVALLLQGLEIVAVNLDREFALHAADGLFHVVRDRLREIPEHARELLQLAVHGGNQFFLVFVKDAAASLPSA